MGKTCAWCGTVLRATGSPAIRTTSHSLCPGCLEDLQSALSTNGLTQRTKERRPH